MNLPTETPGPEGAIKLRIENLSKRFAGVTALSNVTLTIPANRKSVLIGPAASGKTVLMKCIAGIYRAEAGTIEIDGRRVSKAGSRTHTEMMQSIGVLFQQGGLFDSLPVWKNVSFKLTQTRGVDDETARRVAVEKLGSVGLSTDVADRVPAELSGGMQKRVGIARALVGDPDLLLLDEPTAGLDPITTSAINRLIDRSQKELGATVFTITSNMESARTEYDHLFMLNEGKLVWSGGVDQIAESGNPHLDQLIHGRASGPIHVPGRS